MFRKLFGISTALFFGIAVGSALAAPVSFGIHGGSDYVLGSIGDYDPRGPARRLDGRTVTLFNADRNRGRIGGGLTISGAATITATFMGAEAGWRNYFRETARDGSRDYMSNRRRPGSSFDFMEQEAGFVDFNFYSRLGVLRNGGRASSSAMDLGILLNRARNVAFVLFGDGGGRNDMDLDDMVVRLEIAPVPLPASGLLLLGGLGGVMALRRRKKNAAAA